jgi:capsular polysaccharide biosynthesis protein
LKRYLFCNFIILEEKLLTDKKNPAEIDEQGLDLRVYLNILIKRRVMIALITLLAVLASSIWSFFVLKPVYEAKTVLMVTQVSDKLQTTQSNDPDNIINSISRIPVMTMNTYVGQAKNEELMKRVIESMNLSEYGYTPLGLAGMVNVSATKDSYLLDITVSNGDRQLAVDIANTLSREFINSIAERNQEVMDKSVVLLKEQMDEVRKEQARTTIQSEKDRLQGMLTLLSEGITRTQIARSFDLGSTSLVVVSPAMSAVNVYPNKKTNIAIAFLLGLMVSVALALVLEFLDNTIKTPEDVIRHLDLPVMGVIPAANGKS